MNSKLLLSLFTLLVVRCEARGRRPGSAVSTSAFTEASSAATTDTNTSEDDSYVTLVKEYIDAGTCDSASANSICGDDATSYYQEFEFTFGRYHGMTVMNTKSPQRPHIIVLQFPVSNAAACIATGLSLLCNTLILCSIKDALFSINLEFASIDSMHLRKVRSSCLSDR